MADKLKDQLRVFVVPVDIMEVPDLTIHEQMTYIVLRSFANAHSDTAFPSYATIARIGRMTRRHAINCVASLIEKGLLTKEEPQFKVTKDKKIKQTSNVYHIETPKLLNTIHHPSEYHSPSLVNTIHHPSEYHSPEQKNLKQPIEQNQVTTTEQPPVVDDGIKIGLEEIGAKPSTKEVSKWISTHGVEYVLEKIEVTREMASTTPLRTLRAAIKGDWKPNQGNNSKNNSKGITERQRRVVPPAQEGKYERFYKVYGKTAQR